MASDSEASETSFLERLFSSPNRDLSVFIPFILGLTNSPNAREENDDDDDPDEESMDRPTPPRDRIIVINPFTQGMIVIEGSSGVDSLLREIQSKEGHPPASRASIEALPDVEIKTESRGECVVCLEDWEIGGFAKEMPCKHRFHGNCIEKWLGIHGSCPVCRYKMPVEKEEDVGKERDGNNRNGSDDDGEGRRGRGVRREIWVSFGFNGRR